MRTPVALTLLLRLVPGYLFLLAGIEKMQGGWMNGGDGLRASLASWLPHDFYAGFLQDTVLANAPTFAKLVVLGELAVGGLLLIGLLVRPASLIAVVMCLNYLCGKGEALIGFSAESMLLVILLTAMIVNPGRALGVDGFLYERLRLPTWFI